VCKPSNSLAEIGEVIWTLVLSIKVKNNLFIIVVYSSIYSYRYHTTVTPQQLVFTHIAWIKLIVTPNCWSFKSLYVSNRLKIEVAEQSCIRLVCEIYGTRKQVYTSPSVFRTTARNKKAIISCNMNPDPWRFNHRLN
jgi:hypothetical protein